MSNEFTIINQELELLDYILNDVIKHISFIHIANSQQLPYGWGKAKKGRTVWRIVEEIIIQNLLKHYNNIYSGVIISSPDSEVGSWDFSVYFKKTNTTCFVNLKSALNNGYINKDDISKATKLYNSLNENIGNFYIATFHIDFSDNPTGISILKCSTYPLFYLPTIYINPSNGNLQSSDFKNIDTDKFVYRTKLEFLKLLYDQIITKANSKIKF